MGASARGAVRVPRRLPGAAWRRLRRSGAAFTHNTTTTHTASGHTFATPPVSAPTPPPTATHSADAPAGDPTRFRCRACAHTLRLATAPAATRTGVAARARRAEARHRPHTHTRTRTTLPRTSSMYTSVYMLLAEVYMLLARGAAASTIDPRLIDLSWRHRFLVSRVARRGRLYSPPPCPPSVSGDVRHTPTTSRGLERDVVVAHTRRLE